MSDPAPGDRPAPDEIEISIFGPGIGESIAVHVGNGDWFIVDSCRQPGESRPATIHYLNKIGVDCAQQVRLVVASHWHDDHVGGLAETFEACGSAGFSCSDALTSEELITLVNALGRPARLEHSGVNEFRDVLSILKERGGQAYKSAASDKLLLTGAGTLKYDVHALSPSDMAVMKAKGAIGWLLPHAGDQPRYPVAPSPNHAAVVLWIKSGSAEILLGSDLEKTADKRMGWDGVLATSLSKGKAVVIKIAHHGSPNGDHDSVWETQVAPDAIAVVTPFLRSKRPRPDDIERIKQRTGNLFVTSSPTLAKAPRRDPAVERTLREVASRHRVIKRSAGQVRVRIQAAGTTPVVRVDAFGAAYKA